MNLQANSLLRLLQLASPSLPIGAYSYSQGLESAIENGSVKDESSAHAWIIQMLDEIITQFEAPLLWRLLHAFEQKDYESAAHWSNLFIASRDTAEFRAEIIQMGYSLSKLNLELKICDEDCEKFLTSQTDIPFLTAYAAAAVAFNIEPEAALLSMLFSWAENQVLVCVKSVPLGQVSGQRLLLSLQNAIESSTRQAKACADDELCNWAPGLSILSMQHEVQYSRLYRS
jgi:urease accessory protein